MDFTKQEWFYAEAYENQDFINISTFSYCGIRTRDPDGENLLLSKNASNEELGQAALLALSKSRKIKESEYSYFDFNNISQRYNNWVANLMDKYDYKTKRALFEWFYAEAYENQDFINISTFSVSVKTLDTTTAAKLANPKQIYNTLKNYIDKVADFEKHSLSGVTITSSDIMSREIRLAVPAATTKAQWQHISNVIDYGKSRGVKLIVTEVK